MALAVPGSKSPKQLVYLCKLWETTDKKERGRVTRLGFSVSALCVTIMLPVRILSAPLLFDIGWIRSGGRGGAGRHGIWPLATTAHVIWLWSCKKKEKRGKVVACCGFGATSPETLCVSVSVMLLSGSSSDCLTDLYKLQRLFWYYCGWSDLCCGLVVLLTRESRFVIYWQTILDSGCKLVILTIKGLEVT